jgi:phosphopantetheinyl transferase
LLIQEIQLKAATRLGIWKLEEPVAFFLNQIPFDEPYFASIHHPEKQLEFAGSRFLAAYLSGNLNAALIYKNEFRLPYFKNLPLQVSLSHTHGFTAAIVSAYKQVGIDIEKVDARMNRVRKRFLNDHELPIHLSEVELVQIARCWCVKEAVFKCLQEHNITFITDFVIEKWEHEIAFVKIKTPHTDMLLPVYTLKLEDYALAYTMR